jgi:hypothetical protein
MKETSPGSLIGAVVNFLPFEVYIPVIIIFAA